MASATSRRFVLRRGSSFSFGFTNRFRVCVAILAAAFLALTAGCQNSILRFAGEAALESVAPATADEVLGTRPETHLAVGAHGAVAADHVLASQAGIDILTIGGNVVDAAVATAFAVCVVNPASCGIGGGGFMLIYLGGAKAAVALDYREVAPTAARRDMFVRDGKADPALSRSGGLAIAVPGEIAGLIEAHRRHGLLPLSRVMHSAITLARDGFPVGRHLARTITDNADELSKSPGLARLFLHRDGTPLVVGERLRQPALARTLQRVADEGAAAFYRGPVAADIAATVRAHGGVLSASDLASYRPVWRKPLSFEFHDDQVITMPPPSSGGVLLEVLGMLQFDDLNALGHDSAAYDHLLAETMKHGFADRARYYGDPMATQSLVPSLLARDNLGSLRKRIDMARVQAPDSYGSHPGKHLELRPDHGTSHLSVIDNLGNAVACTTTINTAFGAMVMAEDSGVILNNEMDDFSAQPGAANVYGLIGAEANSIATGKRPLSSMSPTIVVRDGKAVLAAGGSGGPLILSATLQALLNARVFGFDAAAAVAAPRLHHQWMPPRLLIEPEIEAEVRSDLANRGHQIQDLPGGGAVQLVQVRANNIEGASDPRKEGEAAAW